MSPPHKTRARALRKSLTDAEAVLWWHLRGRQFQHRKFVRQHPIDRYIIDFCCRQSMLILEIDGGQHDTTRAHDARRTARLEALGYRVVRFWNNEVLTNIEGVLHQIGLELKPSP